MILFKVNKSLKIGRYSTVLPFRLTVCPQIKSNKKPLFNVKEVAKQ